MKNNKGFKKFLIVWLGQLISSIGSGLTAFALGIYIFNRTHSAANYSFIVLAAFLPSFLLKPIGGTLADRFDRRLMMIIGDFGSAIGLVFILFMMYSGNGNLWVLYTGAALSSVFVALQNPAYKASITDLLSEEEFAKASGLMQLAESSKFLASPIIAGFLLTIWDIKNILVIDILTFVIAAGAVLIVKKQSENVKEEKISSGFITEFKEGFRYTFSNKALFILLLIVSLITLYVGLMQGLFAPMLLALTGPEKVGVMQTVMASGMLVSSFAISIFSKSQKQLKILFVSLAVAGIFFALIGTSTNIYFIVASGFLFFLFLPFIHTALDVLIRKNVNNEIQGRVWSIVSIISQIGMVIAFSTGGLAADYIFNPLLKQGGALSNSLGLIIGTGEGRGIAFMFICAGVFMTATAFLIKTSKELRKL